MVDAFEKIPCKIFDSVSLGVKYAADQIAALIREKAARQQKCVIGFATGNTPKALYKELIRLHQQEGLSFRHVVAFNLDEYYPMHSDAPQSYYRFMKKHLFDHIDINPANCFIPSGEWPRDNIKNNVAAYEALIDQHGGIDLQILGIGVNGHIGFNEPGSGIYSVTRLVTLEHSTRVANAMDFAGIAEVPRLAITMGIGTILKASKILLLSWGASKAYAVKAAVEGPATDAVPASLLQNHPDCVFVMDRFAAAELTRFKSPWLTGDCDWTPAMVRRAVINTALKLNKPVLSLTTSDYTDNGLGDLLVEKGDAYEINLQVFYFLRDSITGWPGGKPGVVLPNHPERSEPYPKRCLIFSPHPDDDIISMGGTFQRLQDQGHDVYVAYQTSGNIAVNDEFVTRFLDFAGGFEELFGVDTATTSAIKKRVQHYFDHEKKSQMDTAEIRAIKGLIRRCEARATCRYIGLKEENVVFQNLPFYETGTIEKNPKGEQDVIQTMALLRKIQPHQIYCAGDLADPHGTHKVCLEIVFEALRRIKECGDDWLQHCWVWLYKGAWQEWDITEIEMAIPLSPEQVLKKRHGIFIHQSQKDAVPFQGTDAREFWQRAEERNAHTAKLYAQLGLPRYAGIEAFVRWHF